MRIAVNQNHSNQKPRLPLQALSSEGDLDFDSFAEKSLQLSKVHIHAAPVFPKLTYFSDLVVWEVCVVGISSNKLASFGGSPDV